MISTFRLLGGIMSGGGMLMSYRSLRSVEQGQTVFIAYKQSTVLFDLALSIFSLRKDMDLSCPSKGRRRLYARLIAYPLPFALQILHYNLEDSALKSAVKTTRAHVEKVAMAIDLAVSALFTYYVAPYYGIGILIGLSIEILNEEKVLPAKIKDVWEKAWLGLAFSRLFKLALFDDNDLWDIGLFASELTVFTWEHYIADYFQSETPHKSLDIYCAYALNHHPMEVNWQTLMENPNLTVKGSASLDIVATMDSLIEKVEWTKENLNTFKERLFLDPRFQALGDLPETAAEIPDQTAMDEFTNNAKILAFEIAHSSIKKGDSYIRYEIMQGMLRSILKTMQDDFSVDAVDDLFQLSLSGGDYCGGGKAETIENVYKRRVLKGADIPLRVKFLHLLTAMRKRWFEHMYGKATQITYRLPKGIFDPSDIHFNNICLFYFDKSFKIHSEAIKNDMNITETSFCSRFYRLLLSTALDYTFWIYALTSPKWHSVEALQNEIMESSGVNGLALSEFLKWWCAWVEKQNLASQHKKKLLDEINNEGKIFGEAITIEVSDTVTLESGKVITKAEKKWVANPKLLKLMFYDMGLTKIS